MHKFNSIPDIIADIKLGKIVIMLDDDDRENEGDFVMAAEKVTPEAINFMALYGRGLICTPISQDIAKKFNLTPMVESNTAAHETAFTVTIDAKLGITTGISAKDRAHTISLLLNETTRADDFSRPGHVFPLIAHNGGVRVRRGHTEAAVELAHLAGFKKAGVICEILKEDGDLARGDELFEIAKRFDIKIGTIHDLTNYLTNIGLNEVEEVSVVDFPNKYGHFKLSLFRSLKNPKEEHLAIHMGDFAKINDEPVLTRIHSECLTGDIFGSMRCDCGDQLDHSMKLIAESGKGIVLYLRQEGRGIGLSEKLKAYALQEQGLDTVEANLKLGHGIDERKYNFAGEILKFFGINSLKLLTNNPDKIISLKNMGFSVERSSVVIAPNEFNFKYQNTKVEKLGHFIQ